MAMSRLETILKAVGTGILCALGGIIFLVIVLGLLAAFPIGWIFLAFLLDATFNNHGHPGDVGIPLAKKKPQPTVPDYVPEDWTKTSAP
jgi:hypothetical protein